MERLTRERKKKRTAERRATKKRKARGSGSRSRRGFSRGVSLSGGPGAEPLASPPIPHVPICEAGRKAKKAKGLPVSALFPSFVNARKKASPNRKGRTKGKTKAKG